MSLITETVSRCEELTVTILDTETTSNAIYVNCFSIIRLYLPSAFVGNTIEFLASMDGTTFKSLYDGNNGKITFGSNTKDVWIDLGEKYGTHPVCGFNYIKVVGGTQTADVELKLIATTR